MGNELALQNRDAVRAIATQAREYKIAIAEAQDEFERGILTAEAMTQLQAALTPAMIEKSIMPLQGSSLGFRTDKDKDGGYDALTVRDCTIEAWLRGFYHVGNEFNIIAGRFYGAKAGFERKVRTFPGLANLEIHKSVPEITGGNALVTVIASWTLNGYADKLELAPKRLADGSPIDLRVSVRVNSGMGTDAILGKADRKVFAAIYQKISGEIIPEGEVSDVAEQAPRQKKLTRSTLFSDTPAPAPETSNQEELIEGYRGRLVECTEPQQRTTVTQIANEATNDKRLNPAARKTVLALCSDQHKVIATNGRK